jgi:hypothetical protein
VSFEEIMTLPKDLPSRGPFSLLAELGLTDEDVLALANQGFLTAEYRDYCGTRLGPYFKLRWRSNGRQRVKYLGRDVNRAEVISNAIANLREGKRIQEQLAELVAEARQSLRRAKQAMDTTMANQDRYFHGFTGRKKRTGSAGQTDANH